MACTEDARTKQVALREGATFHPLSLSRSLNPLVDLWDLFHTIRLIRKLKPDIVHTHSPKAGIVGMLAAWLCRVPVRIHTIAGLPLTETSGFKRKLLVAVERLTYNLATQVWPNSNEQKKFIFEQGIYSKRDKIKVIGKGGSNGIDLDYFQKTKSLQAEAQTFRKEHQINETDIVLSFVGRLAYYKGVNELVYAFLELAQKNPNLKLLLIGPFEDINPLMPDVLQQINANKNIINVGHQEDIRKFLIASDIFVFPSYREGFPQSLMQACALGIPAVATDINGCNEIIEHNKSGILIAPKSVQQIVSAVQQYIDDPAFRAKMSAQAQQFILQHFEQKAFWNLIIEEYQRALKSKT